MIDLRLPGLGRLQIASGLVHRVAYENRVNMIKEMWALGGMWADAVRALQLLRFDVNTLYEAKLRGADAVAELLAFKGGERLSTTIDDYLAQSDTSDKAKMRQRLERFAEWLGKTPMLTDVTTEKIEKFLGNLVNERTTSETVAASGSTVNRYRAVIGGLCTWAVAVGRISNHPIAGKKVKKRAEPMHQIPELSSDEYRDYFAGVKAVEPAKTLVVILFLRMLAHTGGDVGEVITRVTRDVDLERRRVRYHRTKTQRYETANRPRFVPLPQLIVDDLRAHIALYRLRGNMPVFGMIERRDVETAHRRAVKAIDRTDLTLKGLRHVAAISWVRGGNHIRHVQRWLGHATLSQTMKYTDYEPDVEELAPAIERAADSLLQTVDVVSIAAHQHQLPLQLLTGT